MAKEQRDWHRLFGLILTDFFTGSPFKVELEKDLSLMKQLLDVVVLRRLAGTFTERLPDGLDELANHNLITFKSYQEALTPWAMKELACHGVNYRKQVSPSTDDLLPEEEFRLFAVCARYPRDLAQQVLWTPRQAGVYDCRWGTDTIRVIVLGQLPQEEHNAPLHLFSAAQDQVRYGAEHYRQRADDTSTLLHRLLEQYRKEGVHMPYTMEDFRRDYVKEHLKDLTPEELRAALSPEEIRAVLSPQERLKGLSLEELLAALPTDVKEALRRQFQGSEPPPQSE
jgi:hypothetical protein